MYRVPKSEPSIKNHDYIVLQSINQIFNTIFKILTTGNNVFIASVIVKSNCHILQFLLQMFTVSALLMDDALLKCVVTVTEVVWFSVITFKTLTFHKVV